MPEETRPSSRHGLSVAVLLLLAAVAGRFLVPSAPESRKVKLEKREAAIRAAGNQARHICACGVEQLQGRHPGDKDWSTYSMMFPCIGQRGPTLKAGESLKLPVSIDFNTGELVCRKL